MFLGVSEFIRLMQGLEGDTWVQLWAGVFGAIPAAVVSAAVAAGVAVMVLHLSNAHQRKLAERAMTEQRTQSSQQLEVQRALAEAQLAEQRRSADLARERAAIADALVGVEKFREPSFVPGNPVAEMDRHIPAFSAAIVRWRLELVGDPLGFQLDWWHQNVLLAAAIRAHEKEKGQMGDEAPAAVALHSAIDAINAIAFYRQSKEGNEQSELDTRLETARQGFESFVRSLGRETAI